MKRISFALLVLVLTILVLPMSVFATDGVISAGTASGKVGTQVKVPVTVESNPGFWGVYIQVEYDTEALSLSAVENGEIFTSDKDFVEGAYGTSPYKLGYYNDADIVNINKTGLLCNLIFDIKTEADVKSYEIKCYTIAKDDINDADGNGVPFTITNGSVTVLGKDFTNLSLTGTGETTYDGEQHTVSVTGIPDGVTADVQWQIKGDKDTYIDLDSNSFKDAGTYEVKAVVTAPGYNEKELTGTLVIKPKEVTVTVPAVESKTYDGETAADEINAALTNATVNDVVAGETVKATFQDDWTVEAVNAGTYSATIGVSIGDKNYKLKEETVTLSYTIKPKPITVTPHEQTMLVTDETEPELTYLAEKLVNDDKLVGALTRENPNSKEVGEYKILQGTLTDENNPNYKITFVEGKIFKIINREYTRLVIEGDYQKEYIEDQSFDPTDMVVKAYYKGADGNEVTEPEVVASGYKYTPTEFKTVGDDVKVKIEYCGVEAEISVKVTAKTLTGLEIVNNKKEYIQDEDFKADIKVYPVYDNGVDATDYPALTADDYTVVVPDLSKVAEEVTVTVNSAGDYADATGTYTIKVTAKYPTEMVVKTKPTKVDYVAGQKFDPTGVSFTVTYNNGKTDTIEWGNENLFQPRTASLTVDVKDVAFQYTEKIDGKAVTVKATVDITVVAKKVDSIEVTSYTKDYIEGQDFDKSSVVLTLYYNDGKTQENFEPGDALTVNKSPLEYGDTEVKLTYAGCSQTVDVNVKAKNLDNIAVQVNKKTVVDGETFSKSDITVTATFDNGKSEIVDDYTLTVAGETFGVGDKYDLTKADDDGKLSIQVRYVYTNKAGDITSDNADYTITVEPCKATVTWTTADGKKQEARYSSVADALKNAEDGSTVTVVDDDTLDEEVPVTNNVTLVIPEDSTLTLGENAKVTVTDGSFTLVNNSDEEVKITINEEEVTVGSGEEVTKEPVKEEDGFGAYYAFYLQMLQWRNRLYTISYKQTEGGTVSGATSVRFNQPVTFTITPAEGYEIADVLVNGKSVGAVDSYTIRNLKTATTVSAIFNKLPVEAWVNPFIDVAETDAFYAAVQYVYENNLFKGMSDTEFAPATTMTRAMFVTVLGRLTGVNVDDFTTVNFADCEAGSWYAPYVEWAAKAGIVKGMSETEFAPDAEITVEQAVTILYRYMTTMGYDLTGADTLTAYTDAASVSDWALSAMQWAVANDVYAVTGTLAPQTPAARSLVATMLYNLSNLLVK